VASSTAFLKGEQLLSTESLVVSLGGGLDELLEVGSGKEVSEVDEFAVSLVLNVDNTPAVLATADLLAVDDDVLLGSYNGEWDDFLR
jgi:hypothetical protein